MRPKFKVHDPLRKCLSTWLLNQYGRTLTVKQRLALELRYGLHSSLHHGPATFRAIGEYLGITEGSAHDLYQRASRNLLRILTKKHNPNLQP